MARDPNSPQVVTEFLSEQEATAAYIVHRLLLRAGVRVAREAELRGSAFPNEARERGGAWL